MAAWAKISTRMTTDQLAFGQPAELSVNILPTELNIATSFLYELQNWMIETSAKEEPNNSIIAEIFVSQVESVYKHASLPTVQKDTIRSHVLKVYEKCQSIIHIPAARRYKNTKKEISDLFDEIVLKMERDFFVDQQNSRKIQISSTVDKEATRKQHQKQSTKKAEDTRSALGRQQQESQLEIVPSESVETGEDENETIEEGSISKCLEHNSDSDFKMIPSNSTSNTAGEGNIVLMNRRRNLCQIAEEKIQNSISDRTTAAVVSPTLRTYNIAEIVDKSKVHRAVNVKLEEKYVASIVVCVGIGYDGQKDVTLMQERVGEKHYTSRKTEEHITIISIPDNKFLGHVSPTNGKAKTVSTALIQFLKEKNIIDKIEALACDGTNRNIGAEGGINHFIEVNIGCALQ